MKKIKWQQWISLFVMLSLVASTIFLVIGIILAPVLGGQTDGMYGRPKSEYVLMLVQCILGVIAMLLPNVLSKKFRLQIPSNMLFLYTLFLYGAIYLGEVKSFYYVVPHWDTILHTFSGAMLGALGFSFVSLLNKEEKIPVQLSPIFVALCAFCFAVTLGVLWEVYEFTFDGILGLNMQKFALEGGAQLIGRAALVDTMKDLIVDIIGAFAMSFIGYISLKYKKGWIEKLLVANYK